MKLLSFFLLALYFHGFANVKHLENGTINELQLQGRTLKLINEAPIANAGIDAFVFEGDTVVLNGAMSSDPENDSLTYQWIAPPGITLNNAVIVNPSFIAPMVPFDTTYVISLIVSDGTTASSIDRVSVTVKKVNKAPVAIACEDVEKFEGDTTTLDGSRSYDPEGRFMTYIWTTLNGEELYANRNSKITFTIPKFLKDTVLVITLVVNDGVNNSQKDQFSITVWHINIPPTANAGKNREVDEGIKATLDGSLSYDPEKRPLLYKWTAPGGITLSSDTDPKPSFTSPEVTKDTVYCFTLVVNDGIADSEPQQVKVTVRQVNKTPVANAGIDFLVDEGTLVTLDGSLSFDRDGDPLKYQWTAPKGVILSSANSAKPSFTSPEVSKDTVYCFTLVVNDGIADSEPQQVKVTVRQVNKMPIANAVLYQAVNEGETVTLDGSLSSDADRDGLVYKWTAPNGIVLNSTLSSQPTFKAPEVYTDTTYTFVLIVNDGKVDSYPKDVRVTVKNVVKPTYFKIYPNPSTGIVTVEYSRTPGNETKALISTISGNVIMHKEITERTRFQVDLSGKASGVYILTVLDNENRYNQQIILKDK